MLWEGRSLCVLPLFGERGNNMNENDLKKKVRGFIRGVLLDGDSEVWEHKEVNLTKLAEAGAHFADRDEWLDDETHWIWEVALEEAENAGGIL